MLNFFRKTKGAVSIFLVIILLPTITVAGLFVDISRVKMSQEVVSTSADLALNTVLSNYDANLKDYFGLLAECQDSEEVVELSKQFFADCMVSAGVDTTAGQIYAHNLVSSVGLDDDIYDMLQLSVEDEVSITPTENSALSNPAMLKSEIIEFMKYRAPVNGIVDLIDKINDSGVDKEAQNASKEAELTQAKEDFYQAEEDLYDQAEKTYESIKKYDNYVTHTGKKFSDEAYLDDLSNFLNSPDGSGKGFEEIFSEGHNKIVKDLYNTHYYSGAVCKDKVLIKKKNISTYTSNTYSSSNKLKNASTLTSFINQYNSALTNYINAKTNLDNSWEKVGEFSSSTDYPIQYWVSLTDNCYTDYQNYVTYSNNLRSIVSKINNAYYNSEESVLNTEVSAGSYLTVKNSGSTGSGKRKLSDVVQTIMHYYSNNYNNKITQGSYKSINTQISYVGTTDNENSIKNISAINSMLNLGTKTNKYVTDLDKAYTLSKAARDNTNKMKKLIDNYKKAFDKWYNLAFNEPELDDSELAKEDRKEIQQLQEEGMPIKEDSFSDSVDDLYTRLDNISVLAKSLRDDLKSLKYRSVSINEVTDFRYFYTKSSLKFNKDSIVSNKSNLQDYADSTFSFEEASEAINRIEIQDGGFDNIEYKFSDHYLIRDSHHLNLHKTTLELYDWMKEKFDSSTTKTPITKGQSGYDVENKSNAKNAKKDVKGQGEKSSDDISTGGGSKVNGHDFSEWTGATLPSKGEGAAEDVKLLTKLSEAGKFAGSIFSDFPNTFGKAVVNTRDDLYMLDYVFEMFTYDTFDYEGCYNVYKADGKEKEIKVSNAKQKYEDSNVQDKWKKSNDKKTLTLTERNTTYNWAYNGEVEYILYGHSSNSENKKAAYSQIYMIRYALDLSPVIRTYWDDEALNLLADALEVFAYIPASLTKTLACLAITAAEAAYDLEAIKWGLPIPLIKEKDHIACSYRSIFMGADENEISDDDDKLTLQYSDYLKIFMFIKLLGKNENVIYTRTADVIQANMTLASGNSKYDMSKSYTHYDFKATVVAAPMWSRLLAVDNIGDLTTNKEWRSIVITSRRGY